MKWMVLGLMAVGVAVGLSVPAVAADERIAVVQLEQLLKSHPDTAFAESVLDKERDEYESERNDMLKERDTRKSAFDAVREEAENTALSDDARKEKIKEAQEKFVALRDYERELQELQVQRQRELNDHGRRLRERIVEKIRVVIQGYAEEKGISLVINSENAGMGAFGTVLYSSNKLDITADVLELVTTPAKP